MPVQYPQILDLREEGQRFSYGDRETILYALGIGLGSDPLNEAELPFVYERALQAVPTLATVIAARAGISPLRLGINYKMVLHGEEETILHRPMPPSADLIADSRVVDVFDKGEGKGAIILRQTVLRDVADGQPIATVNRTIFARADGGCGGSSKSAPEPHPTPQRIPDKTIAYETRPDQAVLYRLSGDRNPLHIEPAAAVAAGFKAPILHGLCTYGITCRAVLETWCEFDPARIASHAARFSSPVYPGERLSIAMWRDDNVISFEAKVIERDLVVLKNGKTVLR